MFGLMQDWPLLCNRILDHAATYHAERQVITRSIEGPFHTTKYADLRKRALRVSQRLDRDGITIESANESRGDRPWVPHPRPKREQAHAGSEER